MFTIIIIRRLVTAPFSIYHSAIQHLSQRHSASITVPFNIYHSAIQHLSQRHSTSITVPFNIHHSAIQHLSQRHSAPFTALFGIVLQHHSALFTVPFSIFHSIIQHFSQPIQHFFRRHPPPFTNALFSLRCRRIHWCLVRLHRVDVLRQAILTVVMFTQFNNNTHSSINERNVKRGWLVAF